MPNHNLVPLHARGGGGGGDVVLVPFRQVVLSSLVRRLTVKAEEGFY